MRLLCSLILLGALSACASKPPPPPSCDGANKRPVNRVLNMSAAEYAATLNCNA